MSQLVKTKRQGNFKDFKRFGAFKGLVEQKTLYSIRSCVNWAFFGTSGSLKRSFHSRFKLAHSCQKSPNLAFVRFYLMYLFIVFCYPHHYKTFATATSNTIGGHLGKGKNVQVGIKAVYLTLRLFYIPRHWLSRTV
jgi:hypothetical protein